MNEFVNYNQRGVSLPRGCKDLIDALRQQHPHVAVERQMPAGNFGDLGQYMSRLLNSRATVRRVVISAVRATIHLEFGPFVMGYRPAGLSALVFVDETDPLQEPAVRAVFEEADIPLFNEFGSTGTAGPMWALRYPLPNVASDAQTLIEELLCRGFGLTRHTPLWFGFDALDAG